MESAITAFHGVEKLESVDIENLSTGETIPADNHRCGGWYRRSHGCIHLSE